MKKQSEIPVFLKLALAAAMLALALVQSARAGSWVTNGPMNTARYHHTATLLSNGKVLIAGGYDTNANSMTNAKLFDTATGSWAVTEGMHDARGAHTATTLANGQILVAGGYCYSDFGFNHSTLASAELYNPASGTWATTRSMSSPRVGQTATLLLDGQVLVAGGDDGNGSQSSAELYDAAAGTWTAAGNMNFARAWHTATLLTNGMVLVAGGYATNGALATVELYDPSSGTWTVTSNSLNDARYFHTATLLSSGRVMVVGGYRGRYGTAIANAELFDPNTETWTATTVPLHTARGEHTATLLANGQVLVAGGYDVISYQGALSSVELFDPTIGTWTETNSLNFTRGNQTATLLPSGRVLVAGGYSDVGNHFLDSTEVYDPTVNPATGTWTNTGEMNTGRHYHTATLLPNGKVMVSGGYYSISSTELFNGATGIWMVTNAMVTAHNRHTATLLPNGCVLIAGGFNGSGYVTADAELFNPVGGTWAATGPLTTTRSGHTATLLPNGKVLVAGGVDKSFYTLGSAELFDPVSGTWKGTGDMITARWDQTATLLTNGKVLVAGGYWGNNTAELYDPAIGEWAATGAMNVSRSEHTATLLPDGSVLVAGGYNSWDGVVSSVEIYNPSTRTWTLTGNLNNARENHSATLMPDGKVLIVGGYYSGVLSTVELYDPVTGTFTPEPNLTTARYLHTATLLSNGRVLIAGGQDGSGGSITNTELYDTGLGYSNAWQPQIAAVTSPLNLGSSLVVTGAQFRGVSEGSSGNTQDSATDYPLVQLRSLESGQTTFLLTTNWSTNAVASATVWNFPPGWALATVFVNGIQSTSSIVNISVPVPAVSNVICTAAMTGGAFQLSFTNCPGALLGVLATTDLTLPLAGWTALGGVTEIGPGQFQFCDPQVTNGGQRFYRVYAP